jgi:FKBP-type peptidyl-prolyl cis-trans isomerase (trigger factor)
MSGSPRPPPPALPDVSGLDLASIEVRAPRAGLPSEVDILRRLAEHARAAADVSPRAVGDAVGEHDEVTADVLLSTEEGPVGGGALEGQRVWAAHPTLGVIFRALVGRRVGERVQADVTFAADYPVAEMQRKVVRVVADIRGADIVTPPDLEDVDQLAALGLGERMPEVIQRLADDLIAEADGEVAMQVREAVFDVLLERVPVEVPEAFIDAGREAAFAAHAGDLLERVAPAERDAWRRSFISDRLGRDLEARKIRIALVLRAIVERDGVELTEEAVHFAVEQIATMMGASFDDVAALVKADEQLNHQVTNFAMQLVAVGHVLDKVRVHNPPQRLSALGVRMM